MKPTLFYINSFDATQGTIIKFSWLGNQPFSNTIIIKDNISNVIMYEKMLSTMKLEHNIPTDSGLVNGHLYNISVKVTDSNGNDSEWSEPLLFYCFTTPTFKLNIESEQIIQAQTYGVEIIYSQPEGEQLQSYRVQVLNSDHAIIYDSNIRYIVDTVKITNLQDNNQYYIVATGETVNGMSLTTGEIKFYVDFIKSEAYFVCEVENMYKTGGVYIKSNIVSVEGVSDTDVKYIDDDIADLTNNKVRFSKGFKISGDFLLKLTGKDFKTDEKILLLSGNDEIITVCYRYDIPRDMYYFELCATYKHTQYIITKDNPYNSEFISLVITRKDTLFDMEVII